MSASADGSDGDRVRSGIGHSTPDPFTVYGRDLAGI